VAPARAGVSPVLWLHPPLADHALDGPVGSESLPGVDDQLIKRRRAGHRIQLRRCQRQSAHYDMLRISPTTFPRTLTSRLRIGSPVSRGWDWSQRCQRQDR